MRLTLEEADRVWATLRETRHGKFCCPWCRQDTLALNVQLVHWPEIDAEERRRFAVLPVLCHTCGFVCAFNAAFLGLLPPAALGPEG
jgi:hypothetical protein